MLNDLARPARLLTAGFGLAVGLMLGGPVASASSGLMTAAVVAGLVLEVAVVVAFPLAHRLADRRFLREVAAAGAEIAAGAVTPVPAVGRVVRRRAVALPWWLPGRGGGGGAADLVVLTALGDGAPRRVAAVVPADLGLRGRDVPVVLLLHPGQREVAVVDDRVTAAQLAAIGADPRWGTERLPSDRTVVGGYLGLLAASVLGVAGGLGLTWLVVSLAT